MLFRSAGRLIGINGNSLDTNVIIRLINGDENIKRILLELTDISISVVVLGELIFEAEKSNLKESNKNTYLNFCLSYPLLEITKEVALTYGKLKAELQRKGRIMPENDIWIAAIANNQTLYSQDKHFTEIEGLSSVRV